MTHIILAQAPGHFLILGNRVPVLLGEILHKAAQWFKVLSVLAILTLLFLKGFFGSGVSRIIQMLTLVIIGMVAIPSFAPWTARYTADITRGSAVGSTGASAGMVILITALFAITLYMTILRRSGGGEEE
jgi:hypothetical protein